MMSRLLIMTMDMRTATMMDITTVSMTHLPMKMIKQQNSDIGFYQKSGLNKNCMPGLPSSMHC